MANPEGFGAQSVHYDRPLSNYSAAVFLDKSNFVAHRIFPRISVKNLSDKFDFYPTGYFTRIYDSQRAEEAVANRINYNLSRKSYSCEEYALRTFISDKKRSNVDSQRNLDFEATMLVQDALLLGAEKRFVDNFLATGVWGLDYKGVASVATGNQFVKWSDAASDPILDMKKMSKEMLLKGYRRPNTALMTRDVFDVLTEHPDIMARIEYGGTPDRPAMITKSAIAALFELDRIEIMDTVYNTAVDGLADANGNPPTTNAFMVEKKLLLLNLDMRTGLMSPNAAVTFSPNWLGINTGGAPAIRRYREGMAVRGEYIEGEWCYDQRIVCPDLGLFASDVI